MVTGSKSAAEILRGAAALLRVRAGGATPGPWASLDEGDRLIASRAGVSAARARPHHLDTEDLPRGPVNSAEWVFDTPLDHPANAAWVAAVHPGLADPLARWLGLQADMQDASGGGNSAETDHALAVARVILGSTDS